MANIIRIFHKDGCYKELKDIPKGIFNLLDNNICVEFKGDNSLFSFFLGTQFRKTNIKIGSNSIVSIGLTEFIINSLTIYAVGKNIKINIGNFFSCWGATFRFYDDNSSLTIGNDCMFSLGIYIWGTDGHAIYDLSTKQCINRNCPEVVIGNHVWIGYGVTLLKDCYISDNNVVGARSLICKKFNLQNTVIAGSPAKIIRKNINWSRLPVDEYQAVNTINNPSDFLVGKI